MKLCDFEVGLEHPLFVIAGPCVIESEQLALDTAGELQRICASLNIPFIYKSSFDKANRSSSQSYRGPGIEKGLAILEKVRNSLAVPVLTDIHEDSEPEIGLDDPGNLHAARIAPYRRGPEFLGLYIKVQPEPHRVDPQAWRSTHPARIEDLYVDRVAAGQVQ